MLDEKALITVDKPSPEQVRLTYSFNPQGIAAQIKDGRGIQSAPGKVTVSILAREGDGSANEPLLEAVREHTRRDDAFPATDEITVQSAGIINYRQIVSVEIGPGPDTAITEQTISQVLIDYAQQRHFLGAEIQPDFISHLLYQQGAKRATVTEPLAVISCTLAQAPWCSDIQVQVTRL
jgi:phage-related baseplate assembly protein